MDRRLGGLLATAGATVFFALAGTGSGATSAVFTVTSTADSGAGSLRAALLAANAAGGGTIDFAIGSGPQTITPASQLPTSTKPVTIDATTQPGYSGAPLIDLDSGADAQVAGLSLAGGSSTVRGLAVTDYQCGLVLARLSGDTIAGDWLGVAPDGTSPAFPTAPGNGTAICVLAKPLTAAARLDASSAVDRVAAAAAPQPASAACTGDPRPLCSTAPATAPQADGHPAAQHPSRLPRLPQELTPGLFGDAPRPTGASLLPNTIGGTTAADRNTISGNYSAVYIGAGTAANIIEGNYIGTLADGVTPDGNICDSVYITGTAANVIGGTTAGARNVIAADGCSAIALYGAKNNVIEGNYLGLDANGDALGDTGRGVDAWHGATNNTIGGTAPGSGNVIGNSGWDGVGFSGAGTTKNRVLGNLIGTDPSGTTAQPDAQYAVQIWGGASGNVIGGATSAARNVLSGNQWDGVGIHDKGTSANVVEGNFIGPDLNGDAAVAGQAGGVWIGNGASANTIGGTSAGDGNVISGNGSLGVVIGGVGTSKNVVAGNLVGLDATGTTGLSNGTIDASSCGGSGGIQLYSGATKNIIGGVTAAARNVVGSNGCAGIWLQGSAVTGNVVEGNYVGTAADGESAVPNWDGISVQNFENDSPVASGNVVGGTTAGAGNLVSGNFFDGIDMTGPTSLDQVAGNWIGTDASGTTAIGNGSDGIAIGSGASAITVGGASANTRNVISGNGHNGVSIFGTGTTRVVVAGNYVGLDATGTAPLGNGGAGGYSGVAIYGGASANTIGGATASARNVISANVAEGVAIENGGAMRNVVAGNDIGTAADGVTAYPNGYDGVGIWTHDGGETGPEDNMIGGAAKGAANVIVFSGNADGAGIWADGVAAGNSFLGNSIRRTDAGATGIQLTNNANGGIAAPTLSLATSSAGLSEQGVAGGVGFRIEVYKSAACVEGHESGDVLLGIATSTSTGWKLAAKKLPSGAGITATQTDRSGNTSAYSACVSVP